MSVDLGAPMRLRLVTLNAWALPWELSFDVHGRMRAIAGALAASSPDVVALQELWNPRAARVLIDGLHRAGLRHRWTDGVGLGRGGLAVVSRHPLLHSRFTRFGVQGRPEKLRHGDYYGGKGFVETTVYVNGEQLTVFNTHLHSRHVSSAPHRYTAERTAQAVELARAVEQVSRPCVVAGDFNMSPSGPVYEVFRGLSGYDDAAVRAGAPEVTHFHRRSGRRERLDYVFVNGKGPVRLAVEGCRRILDEELVAGAAVRRFSDHAALSVDLRTSTTMDVALDGRTRRQRAIATAAAILRASTASASDRRHALRVGAVLSLGVAAGGVAARRRLDRRTFLKTASAAAAGVAGLTGGGLLALAEYDAPRDLAGFRRALDLLDVARASQVFDAS